MIHLSKVFFFFNLFNFWLCWVFVAKCGLSLVVMSGATLHCCVQTSHSGGPSCCRAQALGSWAQWLWRTGFVAPWHVGSSQTRDRTHVPCLGRWILNHWTTREVLHIFLSFVLECSLIIQKQFKTSEVHV